MTHRHHAATVTLAPPIAATQRAPDVGYRAAGGPPERDRGGAGPGGPLRNRLSGVFRAAGRAAARSGRDAAGVVALYLGLRAVGVFALMLLAPQAGVSWWRPLLRADGDWYLGLVRHGYASGLTEMPNGRIVPSNLAFFPLYPSLIRVLDPLLPGHDRSAALAVSWAAGVAAALGIYAVGRQVRDRRTGIVLAALWAVLPSAIVESMAYSETLFTALAAWALYAVLTRRWLTAAALCCAAGLTRPTAAALVVAVCLAALVAAVRGRDGLRPWFALAVAPLGLAGYVGWLALTLGRPDAYLYVQREAWGTWFDAGAYTLAEVKVVLITTPQPLVYYVVSAVLLIAVVLVVLLAFDRVPWPLVVYATLVVVMVLGAHGYFWAKSRLLLPAFCLLLPVATGLAATRTRYLVAAVTVLALVSAWYGAFVVVFSPSSP